MLCIGHFNRLFSLKLNRSLFNDSEKNPFMYANCYEDIVLSLSKNDTFIAMIVYRTRDDVSNMLSGHQQNRYCSTFSKVQLGVYNELVRDTAVNVSDESVDTCILGNYFRS